MSNDKKIDSTEELLAYSLAIEKEAAERYEDLADQMDVHNNTEVAALFRKLAAIEGKHIANVEKLGTGRKLPRIPPLEYQWGSTESPEAPAHDDAHYLMTPYHALSLALAAERRAAVFFSRVATIATEENVCRMASQLRDEEQEHVVLIQQWLNRYPKPEENWDHDPDPPVTHE